MPNYYYECLDCQDKAIKEHPDNLNHSRGEPELELHLYESLVLFETSHSMEPTEEELAEALVCPRCNSTRCERSFHNGKVIGYTLGAGYCDKEGAKRDMDVFTLQNNDPYAQYRVDGEVESMVNKIKKRGKPKPKYFT